MSKLIDELKQQHTEIADTLRKVTSIGVTSERGQKILLAAKSNLLAHLNKEDRELYPVLQKAAESNAKLKVTLELYAKDMDKISKAALEFFEKYSTGGSGLEFARDFGKIQRALHQRIRNEESTLYKKYDELV